MTPMGRLRRLFYYQTVRQNEPGVLGWLGRKDGYMAPGRYRRRWRNPWATVAAWTFQRTFGVWFAVSSRALGRGKWRPPLRFGYSHRSQTTDSHVYVLRPFHLLTRAWQHRYFVHRWLCESGLGELEEGGYFRDLRLPDTPSRPEDRVPFFYMGCNRGKAALR